MKREINGTFLYQDLARRIVCRTPNQKLLLCYYATRADRHGKFFPALDRIAQETGLSVRTVTGINRDLKASGILTWVKGYGNRYTGAKSEPNRYQFDLARMKEMASTGTTLSYSREPAKPVTNQKILFSSSTGTIEADVPETKEVKNEPVASSTGTQGPVLDISAISSTGTSLPPKNNSQSQNITYDNKTMDYMTTDNSKRTTEMERSSARNETPGWVRVPAQPEKGACKFVNGQWYQKAKAVAACR